MIIVTHHELARRYRHHRAVVVNLRQQLRFAGLGLAFGAGDRSYEVAEALVRHADVHFPRIEPRHLERSVRSRGIATRFIDKDLTARWRAFHNERESRRRTPRKDQIEDGCNDDYN